MRHVAKNNSTGRLVAVEDCGNGYVRIQLEPDSPVPGTSLVLPYSAAKDLSDDLANLVLVAERGEHETPVCDICGVEVFVEQGNELPQLDGMWKHTTGLWTCEGYRRTFAQVDGSEVAA